MRGSGPGGERHALLGRRSERDTVDRLIDGIRSRHGGALVVRGEPGIGKTALIGHALAAPGLKVLRAVGAEFESELVFAALHQLCGPVLRWQECLPVPQREALDTAFGRTGDGTPNRFHVGLAVLNLLSEAAAEQPVLCVVDDAHWLDQASAQALAFVARRLQAEPVALIFAERDASERHEPAGLPELACLPEVRLSGLADDEARRLLASQIHVPLDAAVHDRILAEARGNPLALLELPHGADLAGGFALPAASPASGKVAASYRARLAELPAETRTLLLIAAAEPTGCPILLGAAAERLGIPAEAVTLAEESGLLAIGGRARFRHPLVRSTVYRSAGLDDRRAVHRALAEVVADTEPDRKAWHSAQAACKPDEDVAAALERSAERARARGGVAAAAAFLEKAANLTPDLARRGVRAVAAARAKRDSGDAEAALSLLSMAEAGPLDDLQRATVATLRARMAFDRNRDDAAVEKLLGAARLMAPLDTCTARETFLEAFAAAVFVGRFTPVDRMCETAETVRALSPTPLGPRPLDVLLDGLTAQVRHGYAAAVPELRRAVDIYRGGAGRDACDVGQLWAACGPAMDLWDDAAWRELAARQLELVRGAGMLAELPVALSYRALAHVHAGEFADAAALVDEAHAIAAEVGTPAMLHVDVTVAAWRGDEERTTQLADIATHDAAARGEGWLLSATEYARTVLLNGLGRYDAALAACLTAGDLDEISFYSWVPVEFIEAATHAGRSDLAEPVMRRLSERTAASGSEWALGTELRSRALLTEGPAAEKLYREAIERLTGSEGAPHVARARLLYGEWLRREGRRTEARVELQTAYEQLSALGAAAFAARAARELAATGARARKRVGEVPTRLTAQEFRIARLVATGATSKEVGTQLFLSPRTIDAHLRNIFRKLGVTSRRQLRDLPLTT
ncbi:AAA family ATPase [Streptomyces sp. NBC_01362]|uniref:helix-turn-helix transcriptional regulator n=1 Tax=Streptomyces sp. NBC_01362 TaxID=2903839 RepID=UPI002E301A1A|nr:AAA family ATPase [Streptomyces sp. NBC_01362]